MQYLNRRGTVPKTLDSHPKRDTHRQLWACWIKWNRERGLLTQSGLADLLHEIDPSKISHWERGDHLPAARSRAALIAQWGRPPWDANAPGDPSRKAEFVAWLQAQGEGLPLRDALLAALGSAVNAPAPACVPEPSPERRVPRQLPAGTSCFVGREDELRQLSRSLEGLAGGRPGAIVITAIDGTAGAGKTALGVHWAHRVREWFPDGDLYINLRGYDLTQPAVDPADALAALLKSLDVPDNRIPAGLEERTKLYRTLVADKRLLIVLDNASSSSQVRSLLPGVATCLVLVTSRSRLSGLAVQEGIKRVTLGLMTPQESIGLLEEVVGSERVNAELEAAQSIAKYCAHLPLALRIAADRAVLAPQEPLALIAEELKDQAQRLDALARWHGPPAPVRTVFSWSYQGLSPQAKRTFRLLGLVGGPDISLSAAAALLGCQPPQAARLLDELSSMHLLQSTGLRRFQMHDLLKAYASELAQAEEPASAQDEALRRVLLWYLYTAETAGRTIVPLRPRYLLDRSESGEWAQEAFADADQARQWFEVERENLLATVRQSNQRGHWDIAWKFSPVLWDFFSYQNRYWRDMAHVEDISLEAARQSRDIQGEACVLVHKGLRLTNTDSSHEARRHAQRLSQIAEQASGSNFLSLQGALVGEDAAHYWIRGVALLGLAQASLKEGDDRGAEKLFDECLNMLQLAGDQWIALRCRLVMAQMHVNQGKLEMAQECLVTALQIGRESGNVGGFFLTVRALGDLCLEMGNYQEASDYFNQANLIARKIGDSINLIGILRSMSILHEKLGDIGSALAFQRQAAQLLGALHFTGDGNPAQ